MAEDNTGPSLADGTLVRHKNIGYEGTIEGTTQIKACFTRAGTVSPAALKDSFQYRVVVAGELMRRIAPAEDLEVLQKLTNEIKPAKQPKSTLVRKVAKAKKSKRLT